MRLVPKNSTSSASLPPALGRGLSLSRPEPALSRLYGSGLGFGEPEPLQAYSRDFWAKPGRHITTTVALCTVTVRSTYSDRAVAVQRTYRERTLTVQ
jgi:hypothetical protein